MKINFDQNIEPFFQVVIQKVEGGEITAEDFFTRFQSKIKEKNNHSTKHKLEIVQPTHLEELVDDNFFAAYLKHYKIPTWYKSDNKVDLSNSEQSPGLLNTEYDLLVFYLKEDYLFIHSNCSYVLSLIQTMQEEWFVSDAIRFRKLSGQSINIVLSQLKIQYRSLGLQNQFGIGGTAPESKTYHGKDTSSSLTPSFDAGYGFSYCLGSMDKDNQSLPFGCSKSKSKIWTTWVEDLDLFCNQCDEIFKWLSGKLKKNDKLEVLVQSISKDNLKKATPIEFFLDYFIIDKGLVAIGGDSPTLNWECYYKIEKKLIEFVWQDTETKNSCFIKMDYDKINEIFNFEYLNEGETLNIVFNQDEEGEIKHKTKDIVTFLNNQKNFTVIFDYPYAYRDEECWEDNRLSQIFLSHSGEIDWADVDLTKEDSLSSVGKKNILTKIDEYFKAKKDVIICCNDNGANEIADYIAIFENRVVLIHAKFSKEMKPGLRVDDVQVVASQTVKNIRYFLPSAYDDYSLERLYNKSSKTKGIKDFVSFKKKFIEILQNKSVKKECWIVQPGISIPQLTRSKKNKIHTILNFIESILRVNNIEFKLIANSQPS